MILLKIVESIGEKKVVYLQGCDISYIMEISPSGLPPEVLNQSGTVVTVDSNAAYRFDYVFSQPDNVAWLESRRDIVDFDEFAHMEPAKIENLISNISKAARDSYANYKAHGEAYRDEHRNEMRMHLTEKAHEVESLRLLLKYLKGEVKFVFPDEIYEPEAPEVPEKLGFFRRIWAKFTE